MIFQLPQPLPAPIEGFDRLEVGMRFLLGSVTLNRGEIMEFAEQFDPQPFHLDDAAAAASIFGTLVASGFHTMNAVFSLSIRSGLFSVGNLGGAGMDEVRWLRPVKPGDQLSLALTVLRITPSERRPERGQVLMGYEVTNQAGDRVLTFTITHVMRRVPV